MGDAMKKTAFIINVFIMTGSMLIIRLAGMISNIYISAKAGAEAMGLYHVIFSVYAFAITVSVSGTGLAATRLVSEGKSNEADVVKKCLFSAAVTSAVAAGVMFFAADKISHGLICDVRSAPALKMLSVSLPAIAASSVIRGYLIAKRRAAPLTVSQIAEEFSAIFITLFALKKYAGTPYAYMCMIAGSTVSEFLALGIDAFSLFALLSKRTVKKAGASMKDVLGICVPVALGSYLRSGLVALENVTVPLMLGRSGIAEPLGEYGLIRGMAMQIMLFPTVFIQSFSSMLVPEMSEMNAAGRKNGIRYVASLAIKAALVFAFAASAVFFKYHDELAVAMYKNVRVGVYLGMLSLLAVPMYLDTVVDSMLKGLNMQMSNLRFNIADSVLRVAAVWLFLPRFGILAYIVLLYASEIFNLSLSLGKLICVSHLKINPFECIILPAACGAAALWIADFVNFKGLAAQVLIFAAAYVAITAALGYNRGVR